MQRSLCQGAGVGIALIALTGCFETVLDFEDTEEPGGVVVEGVSTTITGAVAKGYAYCDVIAREPVGTALSEVSFRPAGVVVGQNNRVQDEPIPQPTAEDVAFSLTIENYVGPIVIEATNCTYEDETTAFEFNVSLLRTVFDIPGGGGEFELVISPMTEIAYNVAVARGNGLQQGITSDGVESAYRLVRNAFSADGQFDPMTTLPAISSMESSADADEAAVFHGLLLAAFSGLGVNIVEVYDTLSTDLSTDSLRTFYGALEEGAIIFDQSERNATGRMAQEAVQLATAAALNPVE